MTEEERKLHEKEKCANFDSRCKFCVGGRGRRRFHRQKGFKFVSFEDRPEDPQQEHQDHREEQEDEHQDRQDYPEVQREGCRPLKRYEHKEYAIHEVAMDWTTVTKNLIECMTMIDRDSSHGFSFTVPNRTNTRYAAKRLHLELKKIGRMDRIRMKSDGDQALKSIVENVGVMRGNEGYQTVPQLSIPHEHQSNGGAESMNHVIEGHATSILLRLEEKCKRAIAPECRFLLWLPEYASRVRTIYKYDRGGTIYQKLFGCSFSLGLGNIGEKVMYLRHQDPKQRHKFTAKFEPGYYLGLHEEWNRHVFYDPKLEKAIASSTYKEGQFTHEERWDADAIERIKALPWLWDTSKYDHERMPHVKMDDPYDRQSHSKEYGDMMGFDHVEGTRKTSFRVTKALIREFKKTPGCKGCEFLGCKWKIPRCHDKECHQRIFHCLIRRFGLEGAKKLRLTSVDWHNRIKQLENILGNQQDQSEEEEDIPMGELIVPHGEENLLQIEADEDAQEHNEEEPAKEDSEGDDCMGSDSDEPDHYPYASPSPKSVHMSSDEEELDAVVPVESDPPREHQHEHQDEHHELALIDDNTMLDQLLKRDEPEEGHTVESTQKRGRWEACVIREQNLVGNWETIKSNMENPWKDLDFSRTKPKQSIKSRVRILKSSDGFYDWSDPRPCDKVLLAQVKRARMEEEETQAIHLQGITKDSSLRRIIDWGRLNTGEWEKMLGQPEEWISEDQRRAGDYEYYDDNTGLPLEKQKVLLAREEQLVGLCKKDTWLMCDVKDAERDTSWGKPPLGVRWVDIDKPGKGYRSRLVAKDFNHGSSLLERAEFYYPTIPIEIYKVLLAVAAGRQRTHLPRAQQYAVQILDISKAYSYSKPQRTVYIKLPPEVNPDGTKCGKLLKTLEGCRDGSKNWGEELASTLLECGFVRAQSLPSLFYNKAWECWIAAYSDDLFLCRCTRTSPQDPHTPAKQV